MVIFGSLMPARKEANIYIHSAESEGKDKRLMAKAMLHQEICKHRSK